MGHALPGYGDTLEVTEGGKKKKEKGTPNCTDGRLYFGDGASEDYMAHSYAQLQSSSLELQETN